MSSAYLSNNPQCMSKTCLKRGALPWSLPPAIESLPDLAGAVPAAVTPSEPARNPEGSLIFIRIRRQAFQSGQHLTWKHISRGDCGG